MIKIITPPEVYEKMLIEDCAELECSGCKKIFKRKKTYIHTHMWLGSKNAYCSNKCQGKTNYTRKEVPCFLCGKLTSKAQREIKKYFPRLFCGRSCLAKHRNANSKHNKRSKIELWIQEQLGKTYPFLEINYNDREILDGLELDIYIPRLRLAIELNGPFHYVAIFSQKSLEYTQSKDKLKTKLCIDNEIELCVLDISKYGNFNIKWGQKYLNIITDIINAKLEKREFIPDYSRYK